MDMVKRWYGRRMYAREQDLAFRATDRVVRAFDWGIEWTLGWPFRSRESDPEERIRELNRQALQNSAGFFAYRTPGDFRFQSPWLHFTSAVETPYVENNTVHARYFPARDRWKRGRKAVVVLPH